MTFPFGQWTGQTVDQGRGSNAVDTPSREQTRAHVIDEFYAMLVCKLAKNRGADSTHAEGKSEEES